MFNRASFNKQPFNKLDAETLSKIEKLSTLPQNDVVPDAAVPLLNKLSEDTKVGTIKSKWTIEDSRKLFEFLLTMAKLSSAIIELIKTILKIIFPQ